MRILQFYLQYITISFSAMAFFCGVLAVLDVFQVYRVPMGTKMPETEEPAAEVVSTYEESRQAQRDEVPMLREAITSEVTCSFLKEGVGEILLAPFSFDGYDMNDSNRTEFLRVAESLRRSPECGIRVVGHADLSGTREYNVALSYFRARSTTVRWKCCKCIRKTLSNRDLGAVLGVSWI